MEKSGSSSLLEACADLLSTITESPDNQKCFDCTDKFSPRYLCTNFSIFVCSCCANIHKEFGHTIKCLNAFLFSLSEMYMLKDSGNKAAAEKWLALWSPEDCPEPDPTSPTYKEDARKYIRAKYIDQRWCIREVVKTPKLSYYAQQHDDKASPPYASMARACDVQMGSVITNPFSVLPGMQQYLSPRVQEPSTFPPCPYAHPQYSVQADYSQYRPQLNPIPFDLLDTQTIDAVCSPVYNIPYDVPPPLPPRPALTTHYSRMNLHTKTASGGVFALSPPTQTPHSNMEEVEETAQSSGMLRSVSENSIGARMRGLAHKSSPDICDSEQNEKSASATKRPWKVHGIMGKMADLLSPKRTPTPQVST